MPDTIRNHKRPKYKCPDCSNRYVSEGALLQHVMSVHYTYIPSGVTARQYCFNRRNNKTFSICVMCKTNRTEWNENTGKYNRFCKDPACKKRAADLAEQNLKNKTGKTRKERMSDPETQRDMLKNRTISGSYTFSDKKTVIDYVGSYELDFLKFYDEDFNGDPVDLIECPVVFDYLYEKEKKFYIPDFYIPTLNLIIEIKDGGDNPNNHPKIIAVDKEKEKLKDNAIAKNGKYNYIKIVNCDYTEFVTLVGIIKERNVTTEKFDPLIVIPE